jgi:hypothetical protein
MEQPRCMLFVGGPYDGAVEWLVPTTDLDGIVQLCHLTSNAFHSYESELPLDFFGPSDAVLILHQPESVRLRAEA